MFSVSPCMTLIRSKSTPSISWAIWAKVVSCPWPWEWVPTLISSSPSTVSLTLACSYPGTIGRPHAAITEVPMRALLDEKRKSDADQSAVGLASLLPRAHLGNIDLFDRAAQAFGMVAAIESFFRSMPERCICSGRNHVAEPDLVGLDPYFLRNGIHADFHREANAGPRDAAIGKDGTFIGGDGGGPAAIGGKDVWPRQQICYLRCLDRRGDRIGRIGAGIDMRDAIERQQLAILRRVAGNIIMMFPTIGVRAQMLAAILQPAHRMPEMSGEPRNRHLFATQ